MSRHIAIDLGAESGRVIVGTLEAGKLRLQELSRFPTKGMHVNGNFQWNIYRLYEEIVAGLKKYAELYGPHCDSIGVDTWGVDFGLLECKGNLISLPYHYRDPRNIGTDEVIERKLGHDRLYELTGIQHLIFNSLNQLIAMVENGDPALGIATDLLFVGDLLHYFLTGVKCNEFTIASISQLYNTATKSWEDKVFDAFGIDKTLMQNIVQSGDVIGSLRDDICEMTGLASTKIVAPPVHDTASAAVALPAQGQNWAYISSGTWSLLGLELDAPVIDETCRALNISNSGGAFGKSLFLKNVMGLWIIQQCKLSWDKSRKDLTYPQIVELAEQAKPFAGFIDPDDPLFLNPEDAVEAVRQYLGKTGQTVPEQQDVGAIARIVFESLAMKYKYTLNCLCRATNRTVETMHITGGGSNNALLNRFTANALNCRVVAGPAEGTAMGNILVQAYGCGIISSLEEARAILRDSIELQTFTPQDTEEWQRMYDRYCKTCTLP